MALLEICCVPVGTDQGSISSFIADACRVAAREGVQFHVSPTATVLEGDLNKVLRVAQHMHEASFERGVPRVVTNILIDERRDRQQSMAHAIDAVQGDLR